MLLTLAAASPVVLVKLPFVTSKVAIGISVGATATAIFVALLVRAVHLEEIWQEARTLSESAKKLMWLYILNVPPFANADPVADGEFLLALEKLQEQSRVSRDYLAANGVCQDLITDWMRTQRKLSWSDRKDLYLKERILPQVDWYTTRASQNSVSEACLFHVTLGMELLALIFAVLLLSGQLNNPAWVGLLTTMATGTYAWEKMNRHKQLAYAYSVIAQQLRGQKAIWVHISTEQGLQGEVEKTEELISRENTNWSVVRD